jgi:hypothetical protein
MIMRIEHAAALARTDQLRQEAARGRIAAAARTPRANEGEMHSTRQGRLTAFLASVGSRA